MRPREGNELPGLVQFPRWGSVLPKATAELTVHVLRKGAPGDLWDLGGWTSPQGRRQDLYICWVWGFLPLTELFLA